MAYEKHNWETGETITAALLNNIEEGVEKASSEKKDEDIAADADISLSKLADVEQGSDGLDAGGLQSVLQALATRIKALEDAGA